MKKYMLFLLLFTFVTSASAQKRAYQLEDHYRVKNVTNVALSHDATKLAYNVSWSDLKSGKAYLSVYVHKIAERMEKLIPIQGNAQVLQFTKDGKGLFLTKTVKGASQLFVYWLQNDSLEQITDIYTGISSPVLSQNEDKMLFSADVYPDCGADMDCNKKYTEAAEDGPIQANLSDALLFRHWDYYTAGKYTHLFEYDFEKKNIVDLSPGQFHTPIFMLGGGIGYAYHPKSNDVIFVSNRSKEQATGTNADLWLLKNGNSLPENLTENNKAWDGSPVYSPSGKYLAFKLQKLAGYEADKFRIGIMETASPKKVTVIDDIDNWVGDICWSNDERYLYYTVEEKSYTPLYRMELASGKKEKILGERAMGSFVFSPNDETIYYTYRLMQLPSELYSYSLKTGKETKLTAFNDSLLAAVAFQPAEHLWIKGAEGKPVHVLLVKPHDFDARKKYPLVINVHGGPQSQWMDAYRGDAQMYAGYGYVTAFPNPHGSTGYGQEYTAAISGDWGGKVFQDVMLVTDSLSKLSYIDAERIGAMGWSYGGYMMNWLQAKTNKFKCFVSMMGIYNLTSFYGTTEELWFPEWDMKGTPWTSDLYKKYSPSEFVDNFSTPTLIISGEKDYRVSYNQSLEYFTALQKKNVPSRIIIFKNDGHWPSNVKSMPLYYNAHLEWFHKYLGGSPAPYTSEAMIRNSAY